MTEPVIGKPTAQLATARLATNRVDAWRKVTGAATYAAEVAVSGIAHAVIVGSTVARGKIAHIETRAARAVPGVLAVITHLDAPRLPAIDERVGTNTRILQVLQDSDVHYSDQPIAVVVAETLEAAQHAAALVVARYDAEPAVARMPRDHAAGYEPDQLSRGTPRSNRGDVEAGLRAATARVDATYTTPPHTHNPLEPHATIAVWQGNHRVTLYDSTQGIFAVRDRIAKVFGLDKRNVRVINHFVGGGFGCKGSPWSHVVLATMAAKQLGRPVKLVLTRPQMFAFVGHRPETVQRVELGADARGKLTAIRHDVLSETSRFDEFVEPSALSTRMLYACPNVATSHRVARIDVSTPTFTRAPGEAPGSFAVESAMDELAAKLAMDPIELRLRNYADLDGDSNRPWSSKSLRECYLAGAERFGWQHRAPAPRLMRDGRVLVGWGMATATYPARQMPSSATARMRPDGTALVQAGTQDIGTGTYTIMTQIAAEHLALMIDQVRFELGDTSYPETPPSAGSCTTSSTGAAVALACRALRTKLVELAVSDPQSPIYGAPVAQVVTDAGMVGYGTKRDTYGAIVARTGRPEVVADYQTTPTAERDRYSIHAFGADFAEVRVDQELGQIRVSRFVGAFGCGKIINPKTARSQLIGGIVWSIGMALHEHTERDPRTARTMTRDLSDYHVPVHADVPDIEILTVDETDTRGNVLGAKGLGEIGNTGAAAAIANAVYHATGVRVRELPITPEKVFGGHA